MRRTDETCSAPERIVEIGAVALQFGRKATVNDATAAALLEKIGHETAHFGQNLWAIALI